jgi:hypothetical protein
VTDVRRKRNGPAKRCGVMSETITREVVMGTPDVLLSGRTPAFPLKAVGGVPEPGVAAAEVWRRGVCKPLAGVCCESSRGAGE